MNPNEKPAEALVLKAGITNTKEALGHFLNTALYSIKVTLNGNELLIKKGLPEKVIPIEGLFTQEMSTLLKNLNGLIDLMHRDGIKTLDGYDEENIQKILDFLGSFDFSDLNEQKIKEITQQLETKKFEIFPKLNV